MGAGLGPISLSIDGWNIGVQHDLPDLLDQYRAHAALAEEFSLSSDDGRSWFLAAWREGSEWPELVVAQRYRPAGHGFNPGVAFIPQTQVLFVGAGRRLLAYELGPSPRRLWEDSAEMGFWGWSVHGDVVLMAAELELAAWNSRGAKLWTRFVEPPWSYSVDGDVVTLDVMGEVTTFRIELGSDG